MAMSAGNKGSQQTEINVTPLVDVVLVLLIIFMVVAPLLSANIPIRIPEQVKEDIPVEMQPPTDQIVLQLRIDPACKPADCYSAEYTDRNNNRVKIMVSALINNAAVSKKSLAEQLKTFYKNRKDKILFFDANDKVPYGPTVEVMDTVRDLGLILGVAPNAIESK
jgi:biopolymer transport protein ExbD